MEEFKSNSDKAKTVEKDRKIESVVQGNAKTKKKGEFAKIADVFSVEDSRSVGSYLFTDVLIPAVKKVISDIITTGINMWLYGDKDMPKNTSSKVSYRSYYERDRHDRPRASTSYDRQNSLDYDEILFDTRSDAELVLDSMYDVLDQYGSVSIADMFDLAGVPNDNYTFNRYGWRNLTGAQAYRVRDGYILKLPRAVVL